MTRGRRGLTSPAGQQKALLPGTWEAGPRPRQESPPPAGRGSACSRVGFARDGPPRGHTRRAPLFRQYLSAEELHRRHAPPESDVRVVTDWLVSKGFKEGAVATNRLLIHFTGTVGQLNDAFGVTLRVLERKAPQAGNPQAGTRIVNRKPTSGCTGPRSPSPIVTFGKTRPPCFASRMASSNGSAPCGT
ncbi:protease pro-enzyme activation domain-containing protein [Corallococcus sicarius]|uniref:Peptidase S53 activation domain-containing protein n=1 Tax=Corallococcus sicarius TaxID=2316726 RepID=A0A3A8NVE6_9BACT|nr:hypothetical protein D7X12_00150 [Corallococcus sicarius]